MNYIRIEQSILRGVTQRDCQRCTNTSPSWHHPPPLKIEGRYLCIDWLTLQERHTACMQDTHHHGTIPLPDVIDVYLHTRQSCVIGDAAAVVCALEHVPDRFIHRDVTLLARPLTKKDLSITSRPYLSSAYTQANQVLTFVIPAAEHKKGQILKLWICRPNVEVSASGEKESNKHTKSVYTPIPTPGPCTYMYTHTNPHSSIYIQ